MTDIAAVEQRIKNIERRLDRHEAEQREDLGRVFGRLDDLARDLSQRAPSWATWAMTVAGIVIGFLSALAF